MEDGLYRRDKQGGRKPFPNQRGCADSHLAEKPFANRDSDKKDLAKDVEGFKTNASDVTCRTSIRWASRTAATTVVTEPYDGGEMALALWERQAGLRTDKAKRKTLVFRVEEGKGDV